MLGLSKLQLKSAAVVLASQLMVTPRVDQQHDPCYPPATMVPLVVDQASIYNESLADAGCTSLVISGLLTNSPETNPGWFWLLSLSGASGTD